MDVVVGDINGGNAEVARDDSDPIVIEAPVPELSETVENQENTVEEVKMDEQEVNGDVKSVSNKKSVTPIARRKLRKSKANSTSNIEIDEEPKGKGQKRKLSEPDAINSDESIDFNGFDITRNINEQSVEILQKLIAEAEAWETQNTKRLRRSISKGPRRNIEFKTVDDHSGILDTNDMKMRIDDAVDPLDIPKHKKESDKSDIESDDTQKHENLSIRSPPMAVQRQRGASGGKQKSSVDISNPLFREPFKYGWKREIVYIGETENLLKKTIEVYYYTPKGKKVRSFREIAEFLNTKELTIDNFTFLKEPTGVNDPEYEIIREEPKSVTTPTSGSLNTKKMGSVGKRGGMTRRMAGKMASPPSPSVKPTGKWSPVKSNTPAGLKVKVAGKKASQKKSVSPPKETDVLTPMWSNTSGVTRRNQAVTEKTVSSHKTTKRSLKPKVQEPCSIRCSMSMGLIPSLQCCVCLCLYHPECVGHKELSTNEEYICKNCRPNDEVKKSITPPPLIPISMIGSQNLKSGHLSAIEKISPSKSQKNPVSENTMDSPIKVAGKSLRHSNTSLSTSNRTNNSSLWFERANREFLHRQDVSEPKPAQNIALLGGKRYIVVPKNNAMSVQPAIAARPDKMQNQSSFMDDIFPTSTPISDTATKKPRESSSPLSESFNEDNMNQSEEASDTANKDEQVQSDLTKLKVSENETSPEEPSANAMDVEATIESNVSEEVSSNVPVVEEEFNLCVEKIANVEDKMEETTEELEKNPMPEVIPENTEKEKDTTVEMDTDEKHKTIDTKKPPQIVEIDQRQYFMATVCSGYNALTRVFQYLKVQELLRATRVCKMWRDIAAQPALWKTVRMKNSQVSDWKGLAASLQRHGTQHLDLRKMLIPGESDDIWNNFVLAIPSVTSLTRLELCRCPVMVVEKIIKSCPQLEVLCAMSMKCDWLNLESIDKLEKCHELRLKAISGMSLHDDLTPLSQLTQLTHLSLTSVKELGKKKIEMLGSLINLETLELGECSDFPAKFGTAVMCKFTKLERLRLEKGQGTCCTFDILNGVAKLEKLHQLELVNFDVKNGFDKRLANCKNIKRLLIIPTYISQSATSNNMVLGGVTELSNSLTHFVWGVTLELLRVTELFVDQCNQMNKQISGDSIPVLKPVPCLKLIEDNPAENDTAKGDDKQMNLTNPQVDILPLPQLQKLLLTALPKTRVKILKIPFHATWRQSISDSSSQ
ncbi:hypothetical protein PV327_007231 [Microctonus hyperodae]|uniref:F-box/LRR-repeat protein 7 n=2 Tax=Microctonus hyperodae TaxID=165561 RepID=A0AA39F5Z1_MICHY|nr:hypothetical protein PV327_007231 [Microctonus hyperodae]